MFVEKKTDMKPLLILIASFFIAGAVAQSLNQVYNFSDGRTVLLGHCNLAAFEDPQFSNWYRTYSDAHLVNEDAINTLKLYIQSIDSIEIFFGTWCGDSKREVPAFIKVLKESGYSEDRIKLIAVNSGFQQYKQSPDRSEKDKNIHRVPTFILYTKGQELGRVIERPVNSLELDLLEIIYQRYVPNYSSIEELNALLNQLGGLKEVSNNMDQYAKYFKNRITKFSELNTYAIQLMSSFEMAKARIALGLNCLIYPEDPESVISICRFADLVDDQQLLTAWLAEAQKLAPENQEILAILQKQ
jgi:thiol-disulfide isomerase/thioredoxin